MKKCSFSAESDEIFGKEEKDYIGEFIPRSLFFIDSEEDSEFIFDADEEKILAKK